MSHARLASRGPPEPLDDPYLRPRCAAGLLHDSSRLLSLHEAAPRRRRTADAS